MSQPRKKLAKMLLGLLALLAMQSCIYGQRPRFDDFFSDRNATLFPNGSSTVPSIITTPGAPPTTIQTPVFPNAIPQNVPSGTLIAPNNPTIIPSQTFPVFPQGQANPLPQVGPGPQPGFGQPNFPALPELPQYNHPQPAFGFGQNPQPQFRGTNPNWLPSNDWPGQAWASLRDDFLPRLLERPRARQTYLPGSNGNELNINDLELATTLTFPNFLQSSQPLRVTPGFVFHWWGGPDTNVVPGFDLPARAFSSYLSFDHVTNPANENGLETNVAVGFYSDFENTSSDGIRITSRMLGWQRINSYTVAKLGIEYLDRVDVKLLPAFGFYMTPNPDLKLDLYFPKPKLSHRIPNFGNFEAWAYVGGEYGGGSWAVRRLDNSNDQADINDVRAFLGVEWMGPQRVTGFFEFGYVFERELLYRSNALNVLDLQDTIMLRSGFAF